MDQEEGRRPLKVRDAGLAQSIARWLSQKSITPNQISLMSVGFAFLAMLCFLVFSALDSKSWFWPIAAGVFIQCRLLCNLFDGMVAIEGGKSTPSGELFNDIPDRIADPLILIGAGYASGGLAITLGWLAALLAVLTAYIRTLAASIGAPVDFQGPMAKQHRMATITVACVLLALESIWFGTQWSMFLALLVVVAGCVITIGRRILSAYFYLESGEDD